MASIPDCAGMTDMLIRNGRLDCAHAEVIGQAPVALMRGHGATMVGPSLPRLVTRTIFLSISAALPAQTMAIGQPINWIDPEWARLIEAREGYGASRAWEAWKRRAMGR